MRQPYGDFDEEVPRRPAANASDPTRRSDANHPPRITVVETDDAGEEGHRRKVKEADKVEVPPFPEINQLSPWRTNLMNNVAVASGNPDYSKVTLWLAETWSGANFQQLAFVTLDLKLASAMTTMIHKAGERAKRNRDRGNLKMEEASKTGVMAKGRQLVWTLLDSFLSLIHI